MFNKISDKTKKKKKTDALILRRSVVSGSLSKGMAGVKGMRF